MKKTISLLTVMTVVSISQAFAGDHDPKAIAAFLKDSKTSLLDGIEYAEKTSGPATSAKYEVEDGKLMLSVYTVPEGLKVEPASASLTELSGAASDAPFKPGSEIFADKEHIANATVHMTLFQLSPFTLKQVIAKSLAQAAGTPIDVRNPVVRNGRPVADVIIVNEYTQAVWSVTVDLLSGATKKVQL